MLRAGAPSPICSSSRRTGRASRQSASSSAALASSSRAEGSGRDEAPAGRPGASKSALMSMPKACVRSGGPSLAPRAPSSAGGRLIELDEAALVEAAHERDEVALDDVARLAELA